MLQCAINHQPFRHSDEVTAPVDSPRREELGIPPREAVSPVSDPIPGAVAGWSVRPRSPLELSVT